MAHYNADNQHVILRGSFADFTFRLICRKTAYLCRSSLAATITHSLFLPITQVMPSIVLPVCSSFSMVFTFSTGQFRLLCLILISLVRPANLASRCCCRSEACWLLACARRLVGGGCAVGALWLDLTMSAKLLAVEVCSSFISPCSFSTCAVKLDICTAYCFIYAVCTASKSLAA